MTDLLSRDRVSDAPVINALSIRGHHVSGLLSFNPNYRLQEALVLKPGKSWLRTLVTGNTPGAQQVELLSRSLVFRSPAAPACQTPNSGRVHRARTCERGAKPFE